MRGLSRRVIWLVAAVVALTLIGDVIPRMILATMQTMTAPAHARLAFEPSTATVLDTSAFAKRQLPPGAACADPQRLECYQTSQQAHMSTLIDVAKSTKEEAGSKSKAKKQASITATTELDLGDFGTITATDSLRLLRNSTFPVPEPHAKLEVTGPGGTTKRDGEFPEGLRLRFPYTTEQKSFPYFDLFAGRSTPIDYVEQIRDGNHMHFRFHQDLDPIPAGDTFGQAKPWGLKNLNYQGKELSPYYKASRTLTVDPASGEILEAEEHLGWVYAESQSAAKNADTSHTIVSASFHFDQETRDAQADLARPVSRTQDILAVIAWISKALRLLAMLALVLEVVRWQRSRA